MLVVFWFAVCGLLCDGVRLLFVRVGVCCVLSVCLDVCLCLCDV